MSNDMKLIMESWRSKMLLQEIDVNQIPATWGMLAALIKTMIGAKPVSYTHLTLPTNA